MLFLYNLGSYFGYFLMMIIFMVLAIASAESKVAWVWYAIGAVLQLMALYGNQIASRTTMSEWIIYCCLLIVTAVLVVMKRDKSLASSNTDEEDK